MTRPSPALIAHWYAKLRASGFRDVEGGRDLNEMNAWTFRGANNDRAKYEFDNTVVEPWPQGFEPERSLAEHPTAVYFRGLEHAARKLKGRRRKMVLIASQGNKALAGRALGISRQSVTMQTQKFARSVGLLREAHGS